jgi:rRNA maturation protein Rpf1
MKKIYSPIRELSMGLKNVLFKVFISKKKSLHLKCLFKGSTKIVIVKEWRSNATDGKKAESVKK